MTPGSAPNRVLIIDDDIMSREVLCLLLEAAGFEAKAVVSGEDGLDHLCVPSAPPTVVLVDVQLPGISGPELAAALRSACPSETLLIAMSGSRPPGETIAPFDTFLLKPFEPQTLLEAIDRCRKNLKNGGSHKSGRRLHKGGTAAASAPASNTDMSAFPYPGQPATPPPPPVPAPSVPALDQRMYKQLGATMTAKQLKEIYQLCLDDVRSRLDVMRGLAAAHERESFVRQAHAIKGGCGMLGASELYRMAASLERSGLNAAGLDGQGGSNPLDELAAACDRLERILGTRT